MTAWRMAFILVFFGVIALCLLHLRSEIRQTEVRILELEAEGWDIREQSWEIQLEIARLKTPDQLFDRVDRMNIPLVPPGKESDE